ncbi:MAG: pyruvate kinase alpha/beta domain-containing protein [Ruminiclostridium sp.]
MYFEKEGPENTHKTIELAINSAKERDIKYIVVASRSGETAKLLRNVEGIHVVCVTHVNGMIKSGENPMPDEVRNDLINSGIKVFTTTHVLSGAERGISKKFGGVNPVEIIAHSLRLLGQGTKVCVEISVMALDSGLIPFGEKIIAVGGTKEGADTALILTPAHANSIFDTRINEVICKPV